MSIQPPATDTLSSTVQALDGRLSTDAVVIAKAIDMLGDFAVNLTVAAIIFVVTLIAAKWASSATRKILSRTRSVQRDPTVLGFLVQIVRVIVILIGMIAVLQRLGVQTTSIIAVLVGRGFGPARHAVKRGGRGHAADFTALSRWRCD